MNVVDGILATFAKSLREVVKETPFNRMMLETDAPYLAPIPHRGKRNEPLFVKDVAQYVATLKDLPLEEVVNQTTETAHKFFKRIN